MTPFDNEKYKKLQTEAIKNRISKFGKLYIEVGGKLFDDNHAARVLPGFEPDVKMQILSELKENLEVIFCINAKHIKEGKTRGDNGLTYADEVIRLNHLMQEKNIAVLGIVITFYEKNKQIENFEKTCKKQNIKTFKSYFIENYPCDLDLILSKDGFGRNDYIETHKNLILVNAPGPNSGKLETCLSQLYGDKMRGISSCYAKYETFPVWNLPLDHLANVAYEMATADLGDQNMIDPFYQSKYKKVAVNYNRDIDAFPILSKILNKINNKEIYASPTDMGINQVGFAINDDKAVQMAGFDEVVRRFEKNKNKFEHEKFTEEAMARSTEIMNKANKLVKKIK